MTEKNISGRFNNYENNKIIIDSSLCSSLTFKISKTSALLQNSAEHNVLYTAIFLIQTLSCYFSNIYQTRYLSTYPFIFIYLCLYACIPSYIHIYSSISLTDCVFIYLSKDLPVGLSDIQWFSVSVPLHACN